MGSKPYCPTMVHFWHDGRSRKVYGLGGRRHCMQNGLVFNIQRYSVQDGPGIRTTVFLKGCPLRCAWCHNPEGLAAERQILANDSRCLHCGECRAACPLGVAMPADGAGKGQPQPRSTSTKARQCSLCGACIEACPAEARHMVGKEMSVAELLAAVMADRIFFDESGGGVTFSGGEPLMQAEFLRATLTACKAQGLRTAVDTCGMSGTEELLNIAPLTDLFLYDLKLMDDRKHRQYTGVSNERILANLQALGRVHQQIWIRVPVIPQVNDSPADLEATARFAATVPGVRQANLLPFHRTGLHKAERLGYETRLRDAQPPSAEAMASAIGIFQRCGLAAREGG